MVEIVEGFIPMPGASKRFYDMCIQCHTCVKRCPSEALSVDGRGFPIVTEGDDRNRRCEICGTCIALCPVKLLDPKLVERGLHYPTRTIYVPPPETHAPMLPPHGKRFVE